MLFFSSKQFDYNFEVERIALQDAERERERILKEAEEKLKELELNKQLNETQVKQPIEDVINSSNPIQLANYDVTSVNYNNPFLVKPTNQPTVSNYNSFNYNTPVCQEPIALKQPINLSTQTNLTSQPNNSNQTCLSQSNLRTQTTLNSNLTPTISQNKPTTTLTTNYYSNDNLSSNLTRNLSINLPPNQSNHLTNEQLTKNYSDNNLPQTGLSNNTIYNVTTQSQLYSQSHQLQNQAGGNLPNYNINYNPYLNSTINYSTNTTSSINQMPTNIYNNAISSNSYMPHLNHNLPNSDLNQNSLLNNQNVTSSYSITNYVPSSTYTNGILLPQQSVANSSQKPEMATNCLTTDKKNLISSSSTDKNGASNLATNSVSNQSTNDTVITINPFLKSNGKKIDVTDFENSSSPFDDALLRSIDDKEELNNVFQQFYNGAK